MTESISLKSTAFVIMPFADEFDDIYNDFLYTTLTESGYEVSRADDIQGSQNILRDIVTQLANSNIVIADLSGSNPNVYYELGIAHAFRKPVILLTQNVDELPFDLRGYRVIDYTPRFSDIARAKDKLLSLANEFASGSLRFGNPVTDFLPNALQEPQLLASNSTPRPDQEDSAEELGVLDHALRLEEGVQALAAIIENVGNESEEQSEFLTSETARLQQLLDRGGSTTKDRIVTVQRMARGLEKYASSLESRNLEYGNALESTQSSLEEVVRAQDVSDPESRDQLKVLLTTLDEGEQSVQNFRLTIDDTANIVDEMPSIEKKFNRARNEVSKQLRYLSTNAEQTVSMMSRARAIGREKLDAD